MLNSPVMKMEWERRYVGESMNEVTDLKGNDKERQEGTDDG